MTEQHLPRDIAARFERAARHCFNSKVQRLRDIVERFEWAQLYSIRRERTARIERIIEFLRQSREWISVAEIAEYCSEESGIVPNEVARETAYEKILADLLEGFFEENGVSQLMYLHPYTSKTIMTRERMAGLLAFKGADRAAIISQYLAPCWMPRAFSEGWLAKHRMEPRPQRFEPKRQTPSATAQPSVTQVRNTVTQPVVVHTVSDPTRKRRYGPEPGTLNRYNDADRSLFPELERIMTEKQKSRSAAAFELSEAGQVKGSGTPKSRATRLAALYKRDRGGTGQARGEEVQITPARELTLNQDQNRHN